MDFMYKLEKWDGYDFKYEIFFVDREHAERWIEENPEQGFFKWCSIKEVVLNEKIIKKD